ncbi:MAG: hypothetical protein M1343_12540 [Chloroflexi bacterium]|nr:hypothetical protein [Chloroflexota bacterium]MDA8187751.1 hypothetical protein [Dehalococcoidales bacterium]
MSWDNKRIAVADGSGAVRVLSERGRADLFPAWSPGGNRIAYAGGPAAPGVGDGDKAKQAMAQRHIWVTTPDGSGKRELTDDPAYRDERPRWSRDGNFILFARLKDDKMQLWLMRADGSEQRLVADDLSVHESGPASPPIWFAFYGNIGWGQFYDWWTGQPAAKPTAIRPAAATRGSHIAATPVRRYAKPIESRQSGKKEGKE